MTPETKKLVDKAVEAIQDKKGHNITIVDLTDMEGTITDAFVIAEGGSPTQVDAITDNVEEKMREDLGVKPYRIVGRQNSIWEAVDYIDMMVHTFTPEAREHYALERLWADAPTEQIADID